MFDFRSDTVTRPTPAMLEAMTNARVGVSRLHKKANAEYSHC